MFWEFEFNSSSPIDAILDEEGCTLEKLLDVDDVLQECRTKNEKVLKFLVEEENLDKLLNYVVAAPEDANEFTKYKYPSVAAEVLTCDAWEIADAFIEPPALDRLFGYFSGDAELHPLQTSFVSKVIKGAFMKKPEVAKEYLESHREHLEAILRHIATPAVVELLAFLCLDEVGLQPWLCQSEQHFVEDALALLDPAMDASVSQLSNLKQLVSEVVIACRREAMDNWHDEPQAPSPLLSYFLREETVEMVLDYSLAGNKDCLAYGVEILLELVREPPMVDDEAEVSEQDRLRHQAELKQVLKVLAPRYADLHQLVLSSQRTEPLHTASGVLTKPIGRLRLSIIHLVVELMKSKDHDIEAEVIKHGTLNTLLDYLGEYPENNFLHKYVVDMLLLAVPAKDSPEAQQEFPEDLFKHVFTDCQLIHRLTTLWRASMAEEAEAKGHRRGYMGYLLIVARRILAWAGSEHDPIAQYHADADQSEVKAAWSSLVEEQLKPAIAVASQPLAGAPPKDGFMSDSDDSDNYLLSNDTHATTEYSFYANGAPPTASSLAPGAYADFCQTEFTPAFPDFNATFKGSEESEEDVAPAYGTDGIYSPGLVFNTDLSTDATEGENDWMITVPDIDAVGHTPMLSTLRHSSVFSASQSSALAATAGHTAGSDALQRTLWDEDEEGEGVGLRATLEAPVSAPLTPNVAVDDVQDEDDENDSVDSSDEELSGSYTLAATPTKLPEEVALSPRSSNAVRHIDPPANPIASSPVTTGAEMASWSATFEQLEAASHTDLDDADNNNADNTDVAEASIPVDDADAADSAAASDATADGVDIDASTPAESDVAAQSGSDESMDVDTQGQYVDIAPEDAEASIDAESPMDNPTDGADASIQATAENVNGSIDNVAEAQSTQASFSQAASVASDGVKQANAELVSDAVPNGSLSAPTTPATPPVKKERKRSLPSTPVGKTPPKAKQ
eukprot:TRINITY_DN11555_c3_g1_i2.p1 TRINITY_DN11555_c3_g1~~TRINITY_DN11555_c3_g1_i2.p1  ORF type:complete len:962 (+),score=302.41 TRINITY_DN11555_c3_g1_i2:187-3072(+)